MAAITTAPGNRHVIGDLVARAYTLTAVGNGDTLTVPLINIEAVVITPATANAVGATVSGNVITFATGGAINILLWVVGREG